VVVADSGAQSCWTAGGLLTRRRRVRETAANWTWGWAVVVVHRLGRMDCGDDRRALPRIGLLACGMARFLKMPRTAWRS